MAAPNTFNQWFIVVPNDSPTANFQKIPASLYVGAPGNLVLVMQDGTTATFLAVPAGTILPFTPYRVNATGTTVAAGSLYALYQT